MFLMRILRRRTRGQIMMVMCGSLNKKDQVYDGEKSKMNVEFDVMSKEKKVLHIKVLERPIPYENLNELKRLTKVLHDKYIVVVTPETWDLTLFAEEQIFEFLDRLKKELHSTFNKWMNKQGYVWDKLRAEQELDESGVL